MQAALAPRPPRSRAHHNLKAVFSRPDFRRLLAVRLTSQFGDGVFQAGLAGNVFFNPERAAQPLEIAMAFAVLLVPYSVVGPFAGVFLDRWSRRQVLFTANALRALLVLPAAWCVWYGGPGAPFVLSALLVIALNRFFLAGVSASQPHVVAPERLVTANSFATTAGSVMFAAGLVGSAVVFHAAGTGAHPYALVSLTATGWYGLSAALTLTRFHIDALGPDDAERQRGRLTAHLTETARGMAAGLRHLTSHRNAAAAVVVQALHRALFGLLTIMTLLLYRNFFYRSDPIGSVTGLLPIAAAGAAGVFLAALVTPAATRRLGGRGWTAAVLLGLGLGVPGFTVPYQQLLIIGGTCLASIGSQAIKIVAETAIQLDVHDDYRGRVFSVNDTAYNLCFVAGLFAGALLLPQTGRAPAAAIYVGIGYAAMGAIAARSTRRARRSTRAVTMG